MLSSAYWNKIDYCRCHLVKSLWTRPQLKHVGVWSLRVCVACTIWEASTKKLICKKKLIFYVSLQFSTTNSLRQLLQRKIIKILWTGDSFLGPDNMTSDQRFTIWYRFWFDFNFSFDFGDDFGIGFDFGTGYFFVIGI